MSQPISSVEVRPREGIAGSWGEWTIRIVVGTPGIPFGGGFKVQLPRSWHVWHRNAAKGIHSTDPTAANYVGVRCNQHDVRLQWEVEGGSTEEYVKSVRAGLEGQKHRYNYVVHVGVAGGQLKPGTRVDVIYGDRRGGSQGFVAALHPEGNEPILVAVDSRGDGHYGPLSQKLLPSLKAVSGRPIELIGIAPSQAAQDEKLALRLVALDEFQNAAPPEGTVRLRLVEGVAELPAEVVWDGSAQHLLVPIVPRSGGILRIEASIGGLGAISNPIECTIGAPTLRVFWGDIHSHAADSFDATGNSPFAYARDVSGLDFFALTDHVERWAEGTWGKILRLNRTYHDPGHFVTLVGYEATFPAPYGHHNVVFRGDGGPLVGEDRGTLHDLWGALTKGEVLTIPHHTGVCFSAITGYDEQHACPTVSWTFRNESFRKVLEIYSGHGQCETYDPDHPLSYENCDFSLDHSKPGPWWAWDGWMTSQEMGTICSSDNHAGQPGKSHTGLAAVWASELTRDAIFGALHRRFAYGTTGSRILLRFSANGVAMGGQTTADTSVSIALQAVGTDALEVVELVRADLGRQRFEVAASWQPSGDRCIYEWLDRSPPRRGLYYVRLRQRNRMRGRLPMAWSSPIWVSPQT